MRKWFLEKIYSFIKNNSARYSFRHTGLKESIEYYQDEHDTDIGQHLFTKWMVWILYKSGPRLLPWGTPDLTAWVSDTSPSEHSRCFLLDKREKISKDASIWKPIYFRITNKCYGPLGQMVWKSQRASKKLRLHRLVSSPHQTT